MTRRKGSNYGHPREAAAQIAHTVVSIGYSSGWSGTLEEVDYVGKLLAPFGIRYVDDIKGEWRHVEVTPTPALRCPTVHLNGSGRASLVDGYRAAVQAVEVAKEACHATAPHGRDYYVQGDAAIDEAIAQHRARMAHLEVVGDEMAQLWMAVQP